MKKNSTYEIDGDLYEFNNNRLREIIRRQNPNRGAFEQFYRKVESQYVGISYDTVRGWVKKNTNPSSLDDVKEIAKLLGVDYMVLLKCTHISADTVRTRLQKITFDGVLDPFCSRYKGFSNVLDMIIGIGYNPETKESKVSDFAERIIDIIGMEKLEELGLPGLLGYKFVYSEDELRNMSDDQLLNVVSNGYIDEEGNRFYDNSNKIVIDRDKFGKRLIENTSWLDVEEREELQEIVEEAKNWWDFCEMPFGLLKIDINAFGHRLASYTCGLGWVKPTHENRWTLLLDVLALLGTQVDSAGLCWAKEMHVDQFESKMFLTIDVSKDILICE